MGTGIVSIALSLDGHETISRFLLIVDALIWATLAVLLASRATRDRARWVRDVRTPAALTSVAGSAVLGIRLALLGWAWAGIALLVIALALWAALLTPVLRNWRRPRRILADADRLHRIARGAGCDRRSTRARPLAALGRARAVRARLGLYGFAIARFDPRQLGVGRGDQWITGGALAISTLTAGKITAGAKALAVLGNGYGTLKALSPGLWVFTMLWLPVLVLAGALRPRLRYDLRRWSTVFPVGMYAACSFIVGSVADASVITDFARVWGFGRRGGVAVVFTGMLRRGYQLARQAPTRPGRVRIDEPAGGRSDTA